MASAGGGAGMVKRHAPFAAGFIRTALVAALGVGFAIGAHMTFVMGFHLPLGRGFASFMQIHGHVQLVGWAGLFIMGISLHFIPRLAAVPLARPQWLRRIVWLMGSGLALRSVGQALLPYLAGSLAFTPVMGLVVVSGLLEGGGVIGYVGLILSTFRRAKSPGSRPALTLVRPYFGIMIAGWLLYATLNLALLVQMALRGSVVVHQGWNQWAIQNMVELTLLPAALAFSVRMLPLYLRLAPPDWSVRGTAYAYLIALMVQVLPKLPPLLAATPRMMRMLSDIGRLGTGGVILWFVWHLDVLTRHRDPWTVYRKLHPGPERRPTRPGLPDYGEFGRFERLVYAAYVWLVLAALGDLTSGLSALMGHPLFISYDAIRHMYLLGFITLLIFGMAVRMLPGFVHRRRIASPSLVGVTFWCGNIAVVGRVLFFLLPVPVMQLTSGIALVARSALAISGLVGLAAVGCLAVNLWKTLSRVTVC